VTYEIVIAENKDEEIIIYQKVLDCKVQEVIDWLYEKHGNKVQVYIIRQSKMND
jgi:uncharacterized Fe-S radical SAM superfamily protein PflX